MATLEELLTPSTIARALQNVIGTYQAEGFPTQNWQSGGTDATRSLAIATSVHDLSANYIPSITAGGFTSLAAQLENPGWLQLLAEEIYNLLYNRATFTVGDILLTCAATAGPYTIAAGDLTAVFGASGNRYINSTGGVLATSGTLALEWTAETAGAEYNDPSSSGAISLVSSLPGVTLTNVATDYTDVAQVGAGTGSITPSGSPTGSHQITISITGTGAAGAASWSYSLDGSPSVDAGAVASLTNLGGYGINVTLTNGVSGTSFVDGDTYLFNTPGSWITTQGSDVEVPATLAARCQNRWSSLSNIPTGSFYELLAQSVPNVGSQVTQVIVIEDSDINNKVNIVVSGPEGALPPATVALIQAFVDPRAIGTDWPTVQSPSVHDTVIAFTATVQASLYATASGTVETSIDDYVNGSAINPTLRIARIIDLVMNVNGLIDVSDVTIDGEAENLTLGDASTFVVASLVTLSITWVTAA